MRNKKFLLAIAIASAPSLGHAVDVNWNGYISIAGGKTLDEGSTYIVDPMTTGTYDDEMRFESESQVGLQGQALIGDNIRGTVQLVSRGGKQFNTEIDWAYLSYDVSNNLTLNAGRFRLPLFYYSDSLDVGYTYHWIRPPVEVYNVPHSTLQGVSARYTTTFGAVELESQAWYGSDYVVQNTDFGQSSFDVRNDMGVNATFTWEWLKFRAVVNSLDINFANEAFGEMTMDTSFGALALMLDFDSLFWRSEYTLLKSKAVMEGMPPSETTDRTWYASIGYNLGEFTPHYTHTVVDGDPMGFTGQVKTDTIGFAWTFHHAAKLKLEYLKSDRESTAFTPATETKVVSTAIDIVF